MAAEQSAAIFLSCDGDLAVFWLATACCRSDPAALPRDERALVAALFPVMMHLHLVAHRMVMVVGEGRGGNANGNGGKGECKQNFLHVDFLGRTDLVGGRPAILARVP
jgi:hypothetical protein